MFGRHARMTIHDGRSQTWPYVNDDTSGQQRRRVPLTQQAHASSPCLCDGQGLGASVRVCVGGRRATLHVGGMNAERSRRLETPLT